MVAQRPKSSSKFARYRAKKRAQGLREIRLWVPDTRAPGFADEIARQAAFLDGDDEDEVMGWVEQLHSELASVSCDDPDAEPACC